MAMPKINRLNAIRRRNFVSIMWRVLALIFTLIPASSLAQQPSEPTKQVTLEARLVAQDPAIEKGLEWRVFKTKVDEKGELPLLATASGGTKTFSMSAGEYFIHVSYGFASAVRKVEITQPETRQIFILNAGGLQLEAVTPPDGPIATSLLRFDVYSSQVDERGIRRLIARDVRPMQIVPFAQGTYHVVSRYGKYNAETRADLRVQAGKLTQVTMQHYAAKISFRLVRETGGGAIADTSWSILAENGDVIKESNSTFPTMVLSEGNYSAIARNAEKTYTQDFTVESGANRDVEVLAE